MIRISEAKQLNKNKFLFAHMSVGENIIDGLKHLKSKDKMLADLKIHSLQDGKKDLGWALYHTKLGSNGDPELKCKKLLDLLEKYYILYKFDFVLFKFCYIDFGPKTDVDSVFKIYQNMVGEIKKQFSDLNIIHVTCPLTTHNYNFKQIIKSFVVGDRGNIKRNLYNQLLYETYKDRDIIFDLADIEARLSESEKVNFTYKNIQYIYLAEINTHDGRHLNSKGRNLAARELIHLLTTAATN